MRHRPQSEKSLASFRSQSRSKTPSVSLSEDAVASLGIVQLLSRVQPRRSPAKCRRFSPPVPPEDPDGLRLGTAVLNLCAESSEYSFSTIIACRATGVNQIPFAIRDAGASASGIGGVSLEVDRLRASRLQTNLREGADCVDVAGADQHRFYRRIFPRF